MMSSFYDNITNQREKIHILSDMNMNAKYTCSLNENTGNSYYYGFPEIDSSSLLETEMECLDRLEDCLIPFTDKMVPLIQKAETINPIGLTINPVKPISQGDCPDCNADAIAALKSSDVDKVNDSIEKIANPADFFSNTIVDMKACSLNSVEEGCKKATKADIEEAAKKIKNGKKKLSSLKDKASKKIQSKKYKVENLKEEIGKASRVVLHDDNEKEKCSKVSECYLAAICIENEDLYNYIAAVKERTQFLNEIKSSINIITTSALYNPRDIKNTLIFSEMAGSMVSYNFGVIVEEALDYEYVEEAYNLFGIKVDKKKLRDDKYVKDLIKQIQNQPPQEFKDRQNKQVTTALVGCILSLIAVGIMSASLGGAVAISSLGLLLTTISNKIGQTSWKSDELITLRLKIEAMSKKVNFEMRRCKDPAKMKELEKTLNNLNKAMDQLSKDIEKAKKEERHQA